MKIDVTNYEAFFLDYLEGTLNKATLEELKHFLALHPWLRAELDASAPLKLSKTPIVYPNKQHLKKFRFETSPITQQNFGDFCIARHEGLLSTQKEKELLDFISLNPSLARDAALYEKVHLTPEPTLVFNSKHTLYSKNTRVAKIHPVYKWVSAAAGIALLFGIYSQYNQKTTQNTEVLTAQKQQVVVTTKAEPVKKHQPTVIKNLVNKKLQAIYAINTAYEPILNIENKNYIDTTKIKPIAPKTATLFAQTNTTIEINTLNNSDLIAVKQESIIELALSEIKQNLADVTSTVSTDNGFSFFKILQGSVKGINKLTGTNMQLTGETNTEGELTAMSFQTGFGTIQFHHKRKK